MKIFTPLLVVIGIAVLLCARPASAQDVSPEKPIITKMLVANVWPGGYSEVYALDPLNGERVVSNIDFTVFEPAVMIETPDAIYDFFILCSRWSMQDVVQEQQSGSADARGFPTYWPQQLPSHAAAAHYLPLQSGSGLGVQAVADRRLLDLLHHHYQANRVQIEAHARQRAIDQARATAAEAARRALIPPHFGPPVSFKRIEHPAPTASSQTK